jgi:hypothetical protein
MVCVETSGRRQAKQSMFICQISSFALSSGEAITSEYANGGGEKKQENHP